MEITVVRTDGWDWDYDIRRWRMALVLRQTGNRNLDEVKADALSVTI